MINGISSIALPYCTNLALFLCVRLVDGILCGGRGAGRQQFSSFLTRWIVAIADRAPLNGTK